MEENRLSVIDGESLMELELFAPNFCIRSLRPQGLCILGGAPKIGKPGAVAAAGIGFPFWSA